MKTIDKLRKSAATPSWVPWVWVAGAILWFLSMLINVFADKPGIAALNAACFSVFMLCFYAISQDNLNRALIKEIDTLKDELDQRRNPLKPD
jgi:hypothetical protein